MLAQPLVALDAAPQECLPVVERLPDFPDVHGRRPHALAIRQVDAFHELRQRIGAVDECQVARQEQADADDRSDWTAILPSSSRSRRRTPGCRPVAEEQVGRRVHEHQAALELSDPPPGRRAAAADSCREARAGSGRRPVSSSHTSRSVSNRIRDVPTMTTSSYSPAAILRRSTAQCDLLSSMSPANRPSERIFHSHVAIADHDEREREPADRRPARGRASRGWSRRPVRDVSPRPAQNWK